MPLPIHEKITAGLMLSTGIFLAESLSCVSTSSDFESTKLQDPRMIPFWLLENGVLCLAHNTPQPILLVIKFLFPLISLYLIMDAKTPAAAPQRRVGRNRYAFINSELDQFSPMLNDFIDIRSRQESFKSQLEKLELTEDEKTQLEEFRDSITADIMETPVSVYGKNYNLDTVLTLHPKQDPHTRIPYTMRDIQPMLGIANRLNALIKGFHQAREQPGSRVEIT